MKGGCIEGLDWKSAKHIWCKRAMVPIPEGVETSEEEPSDEEFFPGVRGSGGDESFGVRTERIILGGRESGDDELRG